MEPKEPEERPRARKRRADTGAEASIVSRMVQGVPLGDNPVTGTDIAAAWGIGAIEARATSVQVLRLKVGVRAWELVTRCPIPEYDLGKIAGNYGPGTYCIRLAPGCPASLRNKNATVHVSEELARDNGWGRVEPEPAPPAPDVYALQAARTAQTALQRGVDPLDLATMIQTAVDRALQARGPAVTPPDPMAQMAQMAQMFEMMGKLEKTVAGRMGYLKADEMPDEPWYAGFLKAATPMIGAIAQNMMAPRPAPQVAPAPIPTLPAPQAAPASNGAPVGYQYTEEDKRILAPAAGTVKPFLGLIASMDKGQPAAELAGELGGWLPPATYPAVIHLAKLAQADPAALAGVLGANMANPRWADVVGALGQMIQEQQGTDGEG